MTDITPNQNKGILKEIKIEGDGDEYPLPGSVVKIKYLMLLTKHEHNHLKVVTRKLVHERVCIIRTCDIAIPTMKKGEVAVFGCIPGYSIIDKRQILPAHDLQFYVIRLMSFKGEDLSLNNDCGIVRYHILVDGKNGTNPNNKDIVLVHLVGQYEDRIFDERDVTFVLSEYSEIDIIRGIEIALVNFNVGETSRLKIKSKYAFGARGCKKWRVPPNATVEYTVSLKSVKDFWSLNSEERLQQAELFKEKAVACFGNRRYQPAFSYYARIETFLKPNIDLKNDLSEKCKDLLLTSYLNLTEVALRIKKFKEAKNAASNALKMDPDNLKILFQRGKAYLGLREYDLAAQDFKRCLEIDPTNEEIDIQRVLRRYPRKVRIQHQFVTDTECCFT